MVLAMKHFYVYVTSGEKIVVYADHSLLAFLVKFQQSNAQVFRWSLPFVGQVKHISGKNNVVADTLSRGLERLRLML